MVAGHVHPVGVVSALSVPPLAVQAMTSRLPAVGAVSRVTVVLCVTRVVVFFWTTTGPVTTKASAPLPVSARVIGVVPAGMIGSVRKRGTGKDLPNLATGRPYLWKLSSRQKW